MLKQVTISDLARHLKISNSSVSLALSGRGGNTRISEETRRRVLEAASRWNYRANASARAMRDRRFNNIGFFISRKRPDDYAFADILLDGVSAAATRLGQNVLFVRLAPSPEETPRMLSESCLDALVIANAARLSPETERIIQGCGVPVVLLNQKASSNAVYLDDIATGRAVTAHLISRGFRRVAMLSPVTWSPHYSYGDRVEGYRQAMREAGLEPAVRQFSSGKWTEEAAEWLASPQDRPEAVFCVDDSIALRLQRVLHHLRIRCPDEIAIAGCNDELLAAHSPIPLTTFRIPFRDMAEAAIDMAVRLVGMKAAATLPAHVFTGSLVPGVSCGTVPSHCHIPL